jgi:hypothetical protein
MKNPRRLLIADETRLPSNAGLFFMRAGLRRRAIGILEWCSRDVFAQCNPGVAPRQARRLLTAQSFNGIVSALASAHGMRPVR